MTRTWLDDHLDTFVVPYLGGVPNKQTVTKTAPSYAIGIQYWLDQFNTKKIIGMVAIWQEAKKKAEGRTILLPGRDVFLFEVIAGMFNDNRVFRPDISSAVSPFVAEDYTGHFCLDTGYRGSVPRNLKMDHWSLVRYDNGANNEKNRPLRQVFPKYRSTNTSVYTSLSSDLEGCPKYWQSGYMEVYKKGGKILQYFDPGNFRSAAVLTIHVAETVEKLFKRHVYEYPDTRVTVRNRRGVNPNSPWSLL